MTDQLQGWGTLAAAIVALVGLFIAIRTAKRDREEGAQQRQEDREDADRRLAEEREATRVSLDRQFEEQRDRDRRNVLVEQLQQVVGCYGEYVGYRQGLLKEGGIPLTPDMPIVAQWYETLVRRDTAHARLQAHLAALPGSYASLLKLQEFAESRPELMSEAAKAEAQYRLDILGITPEQIEPHMVYAELGENIARLVAESESDDR